MPQPPMDSFKGCCIASYFLKGCLREYFPQRSHRRSMYYRLNDTLPSIFTNVISPSPRVGAKNYSYHLDKEEYGAVLLLQTAAPILGFGSPPRMGTPRAWPPWVCLHFAKMLLLLPWVQIFYCIHLDWISLRTEACGTEFSGWWRVVIYSIIPALLLL